MPVGNYTMNDSFMVDPFGADGETCKRSNVYTFPLNKVVGCQHPVPDLL
jgi:hypothetical protein